MLSLRVPYGRTEVDGKGRMALDGNNGRRRPRGIARSGLGKPARACPPMVQDFWKESERRYREARRLMDDIYWNALPALAGADMLPGPAGEMRSCGAHVAAGDHAPDIDVLERPAGQHRPVVVR